MDIYSFYRLFQLSGGYTLPVLIEIKSSNLGSLYFTNSQADTVFENITYKAVAMAYTPPSTHDGTQSGGSLEIDTGSDEYGNLINFLDSAGEDIELIVKAVIFDEQDAPERRIRKIAQLTHKRGSVNWDGERAVWNLGEDDRLQMVINPWALDSVSLAG
jgi:hypothetical protein